MSSFVPFLRHTSGPNGHADTLPGARLALIGAGLLLLLLACLPRTVHANGCYWTDQTGKWTNIAPPSTNQGSTIYFGAVTMDISGATVVGQYPGGGNPAPSTSYTGITGLHCDADTKAYLLNIDGGAPIDPAGTLFPTEIVNVGYKISASGTPIPAAGHSFSWNNSIPFAGYQLIYYVTALYPPYYQLPANTPMGELHAPVCMDANVNSAGQYVSCRSYQDGVVQEFVAGSLTVHSTGCAISIDNKDITVTLPTIQTQDLNQPGTTLGKTKFTVHLYGCSTQHAVGISLDANAKSSSVAGLINPTQGVGYAQNVGVQLLQADGTTPVAFGVEVNKGYPSGTGSPGSHGTPGADMNIDYYAQYYQTGTPTSGGQVQGLATFTVNYY